MDGKTPPGRTSPPISYARKSADGFWYVAVTWSNGRRERLGPYKTEAVAQEFIKAQLDAWHEGQKLFGNKMRSKKSGPEDMVGGGDSSGPFRRAVRMFKCRRANARYVGVRSDTCLRTSAKGLSERARHTAAAALACANKPLAEVRKTHPKSLT